jgi:hypothetical protein
MTPNANFGRETWKKVDLELPTIFPVYEISSHGRVRRFYSPEDKGEILVPSNIKGYKAFITKKPDKKNRTFYVHKLVAQYFIEKPSEEENYVIHADYNKDNNHVSNLKWVCKVKLGQHHKINPAYKKGVITHSKLTETQVKLLKKILKRNEENKKTRLKMIAKRFGITHTQLNRIRSGENWGHVTID